MEKKELWFEMLTTYVRLMHYENGITIPNMIGAYYCYDDSIDLSSSQCIIRVLNDIVASPNTSGVLINKCGGIHNYVLSELKEKDPQTPNHHGRLFVNMYDHNLSTHLSDVEMLGEYLYSIHQAPIVNKTFSITNGIWNSFSEIEYGYINDIIKNL